MPTSDDGPQLLIDTSVAVALAAAGHEHHQATRKAVGDRSCGLSGHAAFETFSVLTRLPPPNRRTPAAVAQLLAHNFPGSRFLSAQGAQRLHARLAALGIAGGAVYDALVAAAAAEHEITLATRDRRAAETYRVLDIEFELIDLPSHTLFSRMRSSGPAVSRSEPGVRHRTRWPGRTGTLVPAPAGYRSSRLSRPSRRPSAGYRSAVFAELAIKRTLRAAELVAEAIRLARPRQPGTDALGIMNPCLPQSRSTLAVGWTISPVTY